VGAGSERPGGYETATLNRSGVGTSTLSRCAERATFPLGSYENRGTGDDSYTEHNTMRPEQSKEEILDGRGHIRIISIGHKSKAA
jgi:hypothetical protein